MKQNKKFDCWSCKYRGKVAGDAHICYNHPNKQELNIKGNTYGISQGWFLFPVCFDPTWLENCDGYIVEEVKK